jgi:hypothetical protein
LIVEIGNEGTTMKFASVTAVIGCLLLSALPTVSAVEIPIVSIQISATPRGDEFLAIDNNLGTFSYLTAPVSLGPRTAYLGFNGASDVNLFRFFKAATDIDAVAQNNPDYTELTFYYTKDNNPNLALRTYFPVTNLFSPPGPEQIVGTVDAPAATVHAEHGPGTFAPPYFAYSLQFDTVVGATGLAFGFVATDPQPDGDKGQPQFTHYPVIEFEAHLVVPEPAGFCAALLGFAGLAFAGMLGRGTCRITPTAR